MGASNEGARRRAAIDGVGAPVDTGSWPLVLLVTAAMCGRLVLHYAAHRYFADDAYIFLRYAGNFVDGHGLVYNIDERVMGFTSPAFVLTVALLKWIFRGIPLDLLVTLLNTALFVLLAVTLARLLKSDPAFWPVLIAVCFYYPFVDASTNGMETTLFCAGMVGCLALRCFDRTELSVVAALFVALTRPEGVLFAAAYGLYLLWRGAYRGLFRGAAFGAVFVALWLWIAWRYYGSFVPQSMLAKSVRHSSPSWAGFTSTPWEKYLMLSIGVSGGTLGRLHGMAHLALHLLGAVSVCLFIAAVARLVRARSPWLTLAAFFVGVWVAYCVGNPVNIWSWYAVPTSLAFVICLSVGLLHDVNVARPSFMGALAAACLISALSILQGVPARLAGTESMTAGYDQLSKQLQSNVPEARSVMLGDIGIVGYNTRWRVIDLAGLVSPRALESTPAGKIVSLSDLVSREQPDVVILGTDPIASPTLRDGLIRRDTFGSDQERARFLADYQLYPQTVKPDRRVYIRRSLADQSKPSGVSLSAR